MKPQRHSWSEKVRDVHQSVQVCRRPGCGVSKVTHHEAIHWTDYWRQGVKISDRAPACDGAR